MEFKSVYQQDYNLSSVQENIEVFAYSAIAFIIPIILGHEQLIVGSVVNAALVLAALNLRGFKLLPVILFPSLGALVAGVLFGGLTNALVYMVPMIWLGNAIFVLGIKELFVSRKKNYGLVLGVSALGKSALLFGAALVLVNLGLAPALFLTAMGVFQLITAVIGGVFGLAIHLGKKRVV